MTVAYLDSHPTLYMVSPSWNMFGSVLAWHIHEPHTGLEDCLNMLLSCFRKKMSGKVRPLRRRRPHARYNEDVRRGQQGRRGGPGEEVRPGLSPQA